MAVSMLMASPIDCEPASLWRSTVTDALAVATRALLSVRQKLNFDRAQLLGGLVAHRTQNAHFHHLPWPRRLGSRSSRRCSLRTLHQTALLRLWRAASTQASRWPNVDLDVGRRSRFGHVDQVQPDRFATYRMARLLPLRSLDATTHLRPRPELSSGGQRFLVDRSKGHCKDHRRGYRQSACRQCGWWVPLTTAEWCVTHVSDRCCSHRSRHLRSPPLAATRTVLRLGRSVRLDVYGLLHRVCLPLTFLHPARRSSAHSISIFLNMAQKITQSTPGLIGNMGPASAITFTFSRLPFLMVSLSRHTRRRRRADLHWSLGIGAPVVPRSQVTTQTTRTVLARR